MIKTRWTHALKRAAEVEDKDFRYSVCERFLDRSIVRLAVDGCWLFSWLSARWFGCFRRDRDCADIAKRILSGGDMESYTREIVKILAGIETEDASIDPEHVGRACASFAYYWYANNMDTTERMAEIACDHERRLQILDVQEELALLAQWKGETEEP